MKQRTGWMAGGVESACQVPGIKRAFHFSTEIIGNGAATGFARCHENRLQIGAPGCATVSHSPRGLNLSRRVTYSGWGKTILGYYEQISCSVWVYDLVDGPHCASCRPVPICHPNVNRTGRVRS